MAFLATFYLWTKSLHLISVIFWMAGMYYLPRLYVYHRESEIGSALSENYKRMELLLLKRIVNPAMIAAWVFGAALLLTPGIVDWGTGWIYTKLALVLIMSAYHSQLARWRKAFDRDERPHDHRFFRLVNEVPPVLTIFIVVLVVVKPF